MIITKEYFQLKKNGKSIRAKKTFTLLKNGRSADYVMTSWRSGCEGSCLYCYSARYKEIGNPLVIYSNLQEILDNTVVALNKIPDKKTPNQCGIINTVDIGENTDCLSPFNISDTNYVIRELTAKTNWMVTFASKFTHLKNVEKLDDCILGRVRIRASIMPQKLSNLLEPGTCKIKDRLLGLNLLIKKNVQLHLNLSPVILYQGWESDYIELFQLVDSILLPEVKQQLKLEVIFATHSESLHLINLEWRPKAENLLWVPAIQETKVNNRGSTVIRYKWQLKQKAIVRFKELVKQWLPYAEIRYIF